MHPQADDITDFMDENTCNATESTPLRRHCITYFLVLYPENQTHGYRLIS